MKKNIKFIALNIIVMMWMNSCELKNNKDTSKDEILSNVKVVNEVDPVCSMSTDENLKDTLNYQGKLYGFCSSHCKEEFKKNPGKYLSKNE